MCVCVHSAAVDGGSLHSAPHHPGSDWGQRDVGRCEGEQNNTDPLWSLVYITTCHCRAIKASSWNQCYRVSSVMFILYTSITFREDILKNQWCKGLDILTPLVWGKLLKKCWIRNNVALEHLSFSPTCLHVHTNIFQPLVTQFVLLTVKMCHLWAQPERPPGDITMTSSGLGLSGASDHIFIFIFISSWWKILRVFRKIKKWQTSTTQLWF